MTNILITTDFNDLSLNACLKFCKSMFKDSETKYFLLHVREDMGFFAKLLGGQEVHEDYQQFHFQELQKNIKTLYGLDVTTYIRKGRITGEINRFVKAENIDFMVTGTSNTRLHTIGANTHKLIRTAEIPMMTVNIDIEPREIKNILLPLELNLSSRQKIPYAIQWANNYNAKLTILIGSWDGIEVDQRRRLEYTASRAQDFILDKGVDCEVVKMPTLAQSKDFADEVIKYMNEESNQVDLCMVMGRDVSTDFAADPRAQDVIRYAKVPVICVPLKKTGMDTAFL
ncbi:MAG: universal stress protein [Bacteroidales bacterium]|nr:universal stress protein [Bacteroidales bacterium]MBQ7984714.1 universal stress protein [Bacteroidales bacterium]